MILLAEGYSKNIMLQGETNVKFNLMAYTNNNLI